MTGMASLVEFQDFNLNLPHHSGIMPTISEMQTLEEIMAQDVAQPLPTPPLSPDHMCPSPSSESSHDLDSGDSMDITEALLNEMMQYEQLFVDNMEDDKSLFGNGQNSFSLEGNFLVQDCMWNSHTYKPRNIINLGASGLYTPAPSPPPQGPATELSDQAEGEDEMPTPKNDLSSENSSSSDQTDCISPNDVFPTCMLMPKSENVKKTKSRPTRHTRQERTRRAIEREQRSRRGERASIMTRRSSANTSGNSRIQPQASASSESEEEIDVVTVSDRPEKTLSRGNSRRRPRPSSASAPCSRQSSPTPHCSTKKRRHHTKRLQRLSSAGGEDVTESDDEQKRASHNILERKRRNDLKYSFQLLREQVPDLEENQRAPKVIILRKAAEYIKQVRERDEELELEYEREKKREAKLLKRLAYLKSLPQTTSKATTTN